MYIVLYVDFSGSLLRHYDGGRRLVGAYDAGGEGCGGRSTVVSRRGGATSTWLAGKGGAGTASMLGRRQNGNLHFGALPL
eukprot:COSAG01_NODE_26880_length_700_cov_1.189684_1_plen_80_part_00